MKNCLTESFAPWQKLIKFVTIMSIIDHIQYLICRHDCVVVPGLGAFVSQYVPAQISSDGLMLLPPSRMLVFNNVISHDDGLLAGSVARRDGISYESARAEVARDVEMLLNRIDMEGYVEIPRVGRLSRSGSSALVFAPVTENSIPNIIYQSLPAVALMPSDAAAGADSEAATVLEVDTIASRRDTFASRLRGVAKYAAAAAVLIAVGATLSTPVIVNRNIDRASMSMPAVTKARTIDLPAVDAGKEDAPAVLYVGISEADKAPAAILRPAVVTVSDLKGESVGPDYDCYIIVASCASMKEAGRFIASKGGKSALRVIPSDGRYRVYAAVANDYDAAYEFKSNSRFSSRFPSAWVYKKS